ncbi:glycosyltransferase [Nitratireductor sp. ZSWI3]|uniref:glycosyltransferase n=1 Tax=Nitratireductor sp. ZSWI3 TaxID=2966359 RepID=UPI0021502441|nr:glycosyltransferase [Nitratireductor sp. ZSWI3]MCR4268964.1 glycosyltransferase [Nitratireductor sp. ZSWI3]
MEYTRGLTAGGAERLGREEVEGIECPAPHRPSSAADWLPILETLSITAEDAARIEQRARLAGVPFQAELTVSGGVCERALFQALAAELGLEYLDRPSPSALVMQEWQAYAVLANKGGVRLALSLDGGGRSIALIAPDQLDIPALRSFIDRYPRVARRMRVVPPSHLRKAVAERFEPELMRLATDGLFQASPRQSSRFVLNAWQGAVLGAGTVALAFFSWTLPAATLLAVHVVLSLIFFACVILRLVISTSAKPAGEARLSSVQPAEMPVYSVLVALYKEAEIVPDLLVALGRIVWPRSKLEIKLVCESDDTETLQAVRAQHLRSYVEVIEVPPGGPRTKPKALSYALPMTTGDFIALYDAEDRPHPFQLVEAWQAFRDGGERLACVQAPLSIGNRSESWISSMFALEYAALFRGILPWLASRRLMLPLGGTSNHFRRDALIEVGGWDPYNVTEDADLGLRLYRFGFRTGVIANPTLEDAPTDARTWVPQRTRWFKGWAQTWLVHMRDPMTTLREIGPGSFLVAQILFAGMVLSALAYSVFLITAFALGIYLATGGELRTSQIVLLCIDAVNVICGHAGFLALGWLTLHKTERAAFWKKLVWTPAYWGLMSVAAWRCLWQLYWRPHFWEKTTHRPHRRGGALREKAWP